MVSFINKLRNLLNNDKEIPLLAGLGAGLYPMLFYYNNNYTLVNSIPHLVFFIGSFIIIPTAILLVVRAISTRTPWKVYLKYSIPFYSVFVFLFLIMMCVYTTIHIKILGVIFITALFFAITAYRQYKKIILLQFLMAIVVTVKLLPDIYAHLRADTSWSALSTEEQQVSFSKMPNIYIIQPDGYVSFAELRKGYYQYNTSVFKHWLTKKGFHSYDGFRSNYPATLSSNSSLFTMKHHYYRNAIHARKNITGKNNVLTILKANRYTTFLMLENEYLIADRSRYYYDYCNISRAEIPFLGTTLSIQKDIINDMKIAMDKTKSPKFFFIERLMPGHIHAYDNDSQGVEGERLSYIKHIENANAWLQEIIETIDQADPNGLIAILADHGGYVGMRSTSENTIKTKDRDKIYSIFSANLAIRWPADYDHSLDRELVTSVNFFRVLFSYLSDSPSLLRNKEEDKSYISIEKGAEPGIYEYIANDGTTTFKKLKQ